MRAICLHGHYYQPPREDPWLGVVGAEGSAAPDHDWNARVTRECYLPVARARILDAAGRLADLVNCYEWTSFDVGPTLTAWLEVNAPAVMTALRRADAASLARTGHGTAWAQPYVHAILPLSTPRDVRTQIRWGRREFEHRFHRTPEGMWLPEMAVDRTTLLALAESGIVMTILAPHQAKRIRPLGGDDSSWRPVTAESLDVRRLYRVNLAGGQQIDVLFRHASLSQDVAFGALIADGAVLAERLLAAVGQDPDTILGVAVDGETFGHHHRFAEMALAYAIRTLRARGDVQLLNPAAYRAVHPPTDEVEIADATSWSCAHGVERWRSDCGCRIGGDPGWTQAWRAPLRAAIDWLRDELAVLYETRTDGLFRDPWDVRDRYIDCLLQPARAGGFVAAEVRGRQSPADALQTRRALEMTRHALFMQTSCGWFFDELSGLEPLLVLRHAARAIELANALGRPLEEGFVQRLEPARSNLDGHRSGADLYRRMLRTDAATPARVAASGALLTLVGQPPRVPGYEITLSDGPAGERLVADARVTELATGASASVPLFAEQPPGAAPRCRIGDLTFRLGDLFPVQRERLVEAAARSAGAAARSGRREALAGIRATLDAVLSDTDPLPLELALLLGYEEAEAIAVALDARATSHEAMARHVESLRRRGVILPARWLAGRVVRALEERLGALPGSADEILGLLDLAHTAGVALDLGLVQVDALVWWKDASAAEQTDASIARLLARLDVAPRPD